MWRLALTTDEGVRILEQYIDFKHCDEIDAVPLSEWLTKDIVRMIELMDAQLQQRADNTTIVLLTGEDDV
jgi:hypothetical protein